ncbi:MAG TPA: TylF/MycF/NovP-related O-methyltransferase [Parafilimonas sp.]|nr:TylF/MycF/NovP-related O-methyltransferase [Parafilimonas sp.]
MRYTTLELCCTEIRRNNVEGNVAELGVYKGDFAKRINQLFPDKKLYLFDTFEGFDEKDVSTEKQSNFSSGEQDFSDTSVELVLRKMKYPNKCVVKKGFFPDSAVDVDDKFCFVSIDADLYEPILAGLKFFYPRLEPGGYIFVHDFNNDLYKGAKKAVLEFCAASNINYLPIPDSGGSAIILK